jgi:plasmid stabilization system protein ParE
VLFYRIDAGSVQVLRVLHGSRDIKTILAEQ